VQDYLVDPAPSPEAAHAEQGEDKRRRRALAGALEVLTPRERGILEARWLSEQPLRLEQLATQYGVSRERVRQIELRALEKVRATVRVVNDQRPAPRVHSSEPRSPYRPAG
jgi:RNA polymerase sigma-32 factor